jgi:hypothetical protein
MSQGKDAIQRLVKAVMDTEDELNSFIDSGVPVEELAESLVDLHLLKSAVGDVYAMYSHKVMTALQEAKIDDMDVAGARIEIKSAADRKKWNHHELIHAVTKRLIDSSVDMDTGEVLLSAEEIATKVLDFVQPSYWRVKELAKFGINADQYCEVGDYKTNIIVRKAK